jgi:hypothetical protein
MKNHFGKTYIFNKQQLMGPTFFNKGILPLLASSNLKQATFKIGNIPWKCSKNGLIILSYKHLEDDITQNVRPNEN